ncbi:hypothetical protein KK467_28985, partial [Klebsiella pneumoniae]|uniref:hypothetical protein n=1 Tax=Klebsiella pneumoniae TaxID=573 RepID=UPI001BE119A7
MGFQLIKTKQEEVLNLMAEFNMVDFSNPQLIKTPFNTCHTKPFMIRIHGLELALIPLKACATEPAAEVEL